MLQEEQMFQIVAYQNGSFLKQLALKTLLSQSFDDLVLFANSFG